MMQFVPRDVEGESSNRAAIPVDATARLPRLRRQPSQKRQGREARRRIFGEQVLQRPALEAGVRGIEVLVEAGQLALVAASDAQQPVGKNPLVVDRPAASASS